MQLKVKNLSNEDIGTIDLDDAVFAAEVRPDILARVVRWQLAKRRAGTHKVKERGEIARTKAKLYRQKGTGRARHGAASANIFRGGGVVHGPRVRDHGHSLPKKVRRLGMRSALSSKAGGGNLIVIDSLALDSHRTKELKQRLEALGVSSVLILGGAEVDINVARAAANLIGVDVLPQQGANVYDILRRDTLILTRDAAEHLTARLQ
jgi:large subunit ribosomal protein L4